MLQRKSNDIDWAKHISIPCSHGLNAADTTTLRSTHAFELEQQFNKHHTNAVSKQYNILMDVQTIHMNGHLESLERCPGVDSDKSYQWNKFHPSFTPYQKVYEITHLLSYVMPSRGYMWHVCSCVLYLLWNLCCGPIAGHVGMNSTDMHYSGLQLSGHSNATFRWFQWYNFFALTHFVHFEGHTYRDAQTAQTPTWLWHPHHMLVSAAVHSLSETDSGPDMYVNDT